MIKKISDEELNEINGGTSTVTSGIINACTNLIKILYSAGEGVGSAIRRIHDDDLCPTK